MKKKLIIIFALMCVAAILTACGGLNKDALHVNYGEDENYGTGDYLFSTVTLSGSEIPSEKTYSVKELEGLVDDDSLTYQGTYSMLTRGSIFSQHEMTGIKLYQLLLHSGMDKDTNDKTNVRIVSADGYSSGLTLGEIKNSDDNTYNSMEDKEPAEKNVPVILAFGSDGVPLTGPVGDKVPGDKISKKEGYEQKAENEGGPVRLIAGQKSSDEFNAPDNAKWVREIIVGEAVETTYDNKTTLNITVLDEDGKLVDKADVSCQELAAFGTEEKNYYGKKDYYKGTNMWQFIAAKLHFASREGTVKLTYNDGSSSVIDIEYFRNVKGNYRGYTVAKDGLTITNVKPALGYDVNGRASKEGVYALLPAAKGYVKSSIAKPLASIEINLKGDATLTENPYGNSKVAFAGEGIKETGDMTVNEMEALSDLFVIQGSESGISLAALLEKKGLTVDADKITIEGDSKETYSLDELQKNKDKTLLVTRQNGNAIEEGGPVKCGNVNNVKSVTVAIKEGLWTHSEKPYSKYLKTKLKVTGSEVDSRTYTLEELETPKYSVKDSFGASAGVNGYQGVILKRIIEENLKEDIDKPSKIVVTATDGYKTELAVDDVWKGIDSQYQKGEHRDVIIAYSLNGEPLVKNKKSAGFKGENGYGPMRLVVENQISKWVKNVKEIKIGE